MLLLLVEHAVCRGAQGWLPQLTPLVCKEAQRAVALVAIPAHLGAEPENQRAAGEYSDDNWQLGMGCWHTGMVAAVTAAPFYLSGWSQYSYTLWL
jgi:hypothetical protein